MGNNIPLPMGSYRLPVPEASCRRLVNVFPIASPPDKPSRDPVTLVRAPGIRAWGDTSQPEVRGGVVMNGTLYVVAGAKVYSVASNGTVTALSGANVSGNGVCRVQTNGTSIVITPGDGTMYTTDGTLVSQSADPVIVSGAGVADVDFLDQYFVLRRRNTAQLINSGLNALTFNALDVTTIDGAPDKLTGLLVNNREIILPGESSTERWYNAANPTGSPFSRSPQGFYQNLGCAAGASIANQDNAPSMLANDRTIRRLGSVWQKISHDGIDGEVARFGVVSDCIAIPFTHEGHLFTAWTFPNAGRTFVMDFNTGEWHERESRINTASIGRWRPSMIIEAYGMQIVGDSMSGKLGILDPDTHEEWGEPQTVRWTYQPLYSERERASFRRLELGIGAGRGTATGQGSNPLLTLFISNDGGNTFPLVRPVKELGKLGEYRRRVQYHNLGESRARVFACEVSDPIRLFAIDTLYDADGVRP